MSRAPVVVLVVGLGLAVVLVLVGALIAGMPAPTPDLSQPGMSGSPREVNVILRDYHFDPTPLHLVKGETVRFNLINAGLVEHEFVLGDEAVQSAWAAADNVPSTEAPFATRPPASVPTGTGGLRVVLGSGESTTATYEVPLAELQLACHLPGHVELGMVGEVVLTSR